MFWSKQRKIDRLLAENERINLELARANQMKLAAQSQAKEYTQLATTRLQLCEDLDKSRNLLLSHNEDLEKKLEAVEKRAADALAAFEHERELKEGYAAELKEARGALEAVVRPRAPADFLNANPVESISDESSP
jgi:hypothetical protein